MPDEVYEDHAYDAFEDDARYEVFGMEMYEPNPYDGTYSEI